jgi:hypothetical protein
LLDSYRHPDGSRWTGQQLDEATSGVVHRSYVTNLRKGRIKSLGCDKMAAIAKAMGFPPAAWFEDSTDSALDWGLAGALRNEDVRDTVRAMSRMSKPPRPPQCHHNCVAAHDVRWRSMAIGDLQTPLRFAPSRPTAVNRRIPDGPENHGVPGSNPGPATSEIPANGQKK